LVLILSPLPFLIRFLFFCVPATGHIFSGGFTL
jgi:hypothetical protein